jgi:hypothetical protein
MNLKTFFFRLVAGILCVSIMLSQFTAFSTETKSEKKDNNSENTQIEQFNPQSVSPNYDFSFEAIVPEFLPQLYTVYISSKSENTVQFPNFINTYFANLFEHHIAINAP